MGFSAVMGSWNTMPNDLPRKPYQSVADKPTRSRPPYKICPCVTLSWPAGSKPMMACAVTDLPEPDSPTTHRISLRLTV
ncbi:hypothetical protein D3C87_2147100 [compost metagenome]